MLDNPACVPGLPRRARQLLLPGSAGGLHQGPDTGAQRCYGYGGSHRGADAAGVVHESSGAAVFGDIPEVVKDKGMMQQFCSLPYAAVLAWVKSDDLQVHSENCVVFLLSAWVQANQASTAAQREELTRHIRVFHLGPAYLHQVLPNLSWFKSCSGMRHLPAVLACIRAGITMSEGREKEKRIKKDLGCAPAWMAKPRGHSSCPRTGSWVIGSSQLDKVNNQTLSPPVYVNGFLVHIYVKQVATAPSAATPGTTGTTMGLFRGISRVPTAQSGLQLPDDIMVAMGRVSVRVGSPDSQMSKEDTLDGPYVLGCDVSQGVPSFLGRSAPSFLELVDPYLREGQLQIEAAFTEVDMVM